LEKTGCKKTATLILYAYKHHLLNENKEAWAGDQGCFYRNKKSVQVIAPLLSIKRFKRSSSREGVFA
jgi:hypothetical protein